MIRKNAISNIILLLPGFLLPAQQYIIPKTPAMVHVVQDDGPYVLYQNNQVFAKFVMNDHGLKTIREESAPDGQKEMLNLSVATDEPGKTFQVHLKNKLQVENSEYKNPKKQLVISDIEGNFSSFRMLLQVCGVVNESLNWSFGEGHLVLNGDFFDRGSQVTEVLWLIYSLEEQAKKAGGYVHFILGNHEIMNLSGDLRYVLPKYKENADLMNERYTDLYGEDSELGRWLRTKNIVEKIGKVLFMHGGISSEMNWVNKSIQGINDLARPMYADNSFLYKNRKQEIIFSNAGPFWYRGYYGAPEKATPEQIDSTLKRYEVSHIATGHTIVADTVSSWFDGRIFNTDVHHAGGHSEALLIENDKFYRVNLQGQKFRLPD